VGAEVLIPLPPFCSGCMVSHVPVLGIPASLTPGCRSSLCLGKGEQRSGGEGSQPSAVHSAKTEVKVTEEAAQHPEAERGRLASFPVLPRWKAGMVLGPHSSREWDRWPWSRCGGTTRRSSSLAMAAGG